jgi:hypothetical protein
MENLLPAVVGGCVALLLRASLKFALTARATRKKRRSYQCAVPSVPGEPAAIQHGWGSAACDLKSKREVWAYNGVQHVLDHEGQDRRFEHTLFGPYTNDFGRPGYFRVRFRIRGGGFGGGHRPLIFLDVQQAPYGRTNDYFLLAQSVVTPKMLTGQFQTFDVECFSSGTGVFEYRARVVAGEFRPLEHEIVFDSITVQRVLAPEDFS